MVDCDRRAGIPSQRQGREMKKPGATPQGNSGDHKSAEGANFCGGVNKLLESLPSMLDISRLQRFLTEGDLPWGVAPGFCISRRWRLVECCFQNRTYSDRDLP